MTANDKKAIKIGVIAFGIGVIIWLLLRNKGQVLQAVADNVPGFSISSPQTVEEYNIPGFTYTPHDYPLPSIISDSGIKPAAPCNFCITSRATVNTPSQPVTKAASYVPVSIPQSFGGASIGFTNGPKRYSVPDNGWLN